MIKTQEKGVTKHKSGKWVISLIYNGRANYHGIYNTLEEANEICKELKESLKNKLIYKGYDNYVDNRELFIEIVISKAMGKLTNRATTILLLMVNRINTKFRYSCIEDREDTIQYSIYVVLKFWYNFDENVYDNPFAYFTEIIKRAHAHQFAELMVGRNNISIEGTFEDGILNI